MYIFINEELNVVESENHSEVFEVYESTQNNKKAIYELVNNNLKIINTPLSFFDQNDILLKSKFKNKIKKDLKCL